jgi:hypothetical protein
MAIRSDSGRKNNASEEEEYRSGWLKDERRSWTVWIGVS